MSEYSFELLERSGDGVISAVLVTAPTHEGAYREIMHYAAQYAQDGPVIVREVGAPATPAEVERLRIACDGIADDYMTSDAHHPGYVLIPIAKFEAICAARAALHHTGGRG